MNAETKFALSCLAALIVGLALICIGSWPSYQLGAVFAGIALTVASLVMFAMIWRARL